MAKLRFLCILDDSPNVFPASVDEDADVLQLKKEILQSLIVGVPPVREMNVSARNLDVWKLHKSLEIEPVRGLPERLSQLSEEFFIKMNEPTDPLTLHFPQKILAGHLHLVVQLPDPKSPTLPTWTISRQATVSALYQKLNVQQFIQVRGTPASGKTTLAQLLLLHIKQCEPDTPIIWVQCWPIDQVHTDGWYWVGYFKSKGWIQGTNTVFIFDEAQATYNDSGLWNNFFKDLRSFPECRVIAFSRYGSPMSHRPVSLTSMFIGDQQKVTLRPIQQEDDLPPVGLLFTRAEFDELVAKAFPSPQYCLDPSFFDLVFDATAGHVGAALDFVRVVVADDVYRSIKNTDGVFTARSFREVNLETFIRQLESYADEFAKGIPPDRILQTPSFKRVFCHVIRHSHVRREDLASEGDKTALAECWQNGWLHSDLLTGIDLPDDVGYAFASPLHAWYVGWKLWNNARQSMPSNEHARPAMPYGKPDILEFMVDVFRNFSAPALLSERIGPAFIQRPPETKYQDEFYRSCYTLSNGSLLTLPEFGTATGRIDFHMPDKKWGIELLREGDQLKQHSGRFSQPSSCLTLPVVDYIILECRSTRPGEPHPEHPKLYHVIFTHTPQVSCSVEILDNALHTVSRGEFTLLES